MNAHSYSLGLYEKSMPNTLSLAEKLRTAKETGFDFVEISIDETDEKLVRLDMSPQERCDIVDLMYQEGIRFETMCLSGHRKYPLGSPDPAIRALGLEIMEKAILFARDLGIRVIQIAGYDVYYGESTDETRLLFAEALAAGVKSAAKYGVLLAFETMETEFLNTVEKAMGWVDRISSPYLAVYPDAGNLTNAAKEYDRDVLNDIELGHGHIAALHLKETVPGKYREIPFGSGHVNFTSIIRKTYGMGNRRYTAEFWYNGQEDWKKDIFYANDFLRKKFLDVGVH
jgi:hexulose-6-phosphate isomerase, putative